VTDVFARACDIAANILDPPVHEHENDPDGWVRSKLNEYIWSKQQSILRALLVHDRVGVPACHDSGKSFIAARAAGWWLDVHPPGTAWVVSTAPTAPQVRAVLWREIGRAHRKGKLIGRVNQTEWFLDHSRDHYKTTRHGEELVGYGRKPAETAAFQGIHAQFVLVIIDEADGVPAEIFEAAETIATNQHARILALGNPVDPTSEFAQAVRPPATINLAAAIDDPDFDYEYDSPSGWHVIGIDGLRTPNFTDEGTDLPLDVRESLLSQRWVADIETKHGKGSGFYIGRVRGRHPVDVENGVIRQSHVLRCRHFDDDGEPIPPESLWKPHQLLPVELGVDVGAGGDETVIRERRGVRLGRVWRQRDPDTMEAVNLVVNAIRETGATCVKVDTIGIGKGVVDRLRQLQAEGTIRSTIVAVNVGESALDPEQYPRLRDQLWWEIGRELTESQAVDFTEIDEETISQLVGPILLPPDATNRTRVEPKVETKKRIGRSPDDADAVLLAYVHLPEREGLVEYYEPVEISRY
jgi:hypothetical protein